MGYKRDELRAESSLTIFRHSVRPVLRKFACKFNREVTGVGDAHFNILCGPIGL